MYVVAHTDAFMRGVIGQTTDISAAQLERDAKIPHLRGIRHESICSDFITFDF